MPILAPFFRAMVAREATQGDQTESADMKETPPRNFETLTAPKSSRALRFDWQDWLPYLEDSDASDEQKRELIEALWTVVLGFVDLGYEVKSSAEICGEAIDLAAILRAAVVNSEDDPKTEKEARDG